MQRNLCSNLSIFNRFMKEVIRDWILIKRILTSDVIYVDAIKVKLNRYWFLSLIQSLSNLKSTLSIVYVNSEMNETVRR